MSEIILSCDGLSKSFQRAVHPTVHVQDRILHWKKHAESWNVQALKDISLSVRRGEWLGVYGPNGSGKTTLLLILAGLLKKDAGSVSLDGDLSCFLGLGAGFHPEHTAYENISQHMVLHGTSKKRMQELMHSIIEFAGLESHKDLPFKCYSTGMQLRLAFSTAVHVDSDLYLLDEVVAVGDASFREQCEQKLLSMKEEGKSAIIVSHDLEQLERICDTVQFMHDGVLSLQRDSAPSLVVA